MTTGWWVWVAGVLVLIVAALAFFYTGRRRPEPNVPPRRNPTAPDGEPTFTNIDSNGRRRTAPSSSTVRGRPEPQPERRDDGGSVATSALVGAATGSAILGAAVGGSIAGGIMGAAMASPRRESLHEDAPARVEMARHEPDHTPAYEPAAESSVSYDSGSSGGGFSDSGGGGFSDSGGSGGFSE